MAYLPLTVCAALLTFALPSSLAVSSSVTDWLVVAQSTIIATSVDHQPAARLYADVASAQYDAIKIVRDYKKTKLSEEAAVAYASHSVLSHFFHWRQSTIYDLLLQQQLTKWGISDSHINIFREVLVPVIQSRLQKRIRDNGSIYANFRPAGNGTANWGKYQFTPGQTSARYPQLAYATANYLAPADVDAITKEFKRFQLDDPEYARQLQQTKDYGSLNSTVRNAYDSGSPRFWALGGGTGTVAGLFLNATIDVIPTSTPLIHQARFFKLLASSFFDAAVATWRVKYRELFWRPITAIRTAHGVGTADPSWSPLLPTPAHPEYPSGHQASAGAWTAILEAYFGALYPLNFTSYGALDISPRPYPSFRAAAVECGDSRLYAGVHFNKSNVDGFAIGYKVAQHIHAKHFAGKTFADSI
ncbi:hypothetical protein HYH02_000284 [Chlamydomonas schloesseri]|uniref:Phosphatidic acid phosphatase type 2/haloperoxidase domain-containing protein n=1 Tax=Chlamydomonas schloesseri TaxID=2026947 RepID=A0A835WMP4_9CHLO|nr:hypothetical protein HYH02_000284 [Chlamydomonas schloesseri]|eukprot:KAG2450182.1 hypothetical protein HYH02_000284 [Chlamydomonas schloesseri]